MTFESMPFRTVFTAGIFAATIGAALAQGISDAPAPNEAAPGTTADRITAAVAARELRAMNYTVEVATDTRGDPRLTTTVDGFKWAVFFYGCDKDGTLEERRCTSLQFFSGYTMNSPVSALTMNKWNAENRYTRSYTGTTDGRSAARISMDVMFSGTGADPARMFRAYFSMMKHQTAEFRKLINFN